jgi:hypothetical protein
LLLAPLLQTSSISNAKEQQVGKKFSFCAVAGLSAMAVISPSLAATPNEPVGEVALSNDTLELRYRGDDERVDVAGSSVTAAILLSEQRDIVLSGAMLFPAALGWNRLTARFGPQGYAALLKDENDDVFAVSVGAELRFTMNERSGLAIAGHAFYAPDVLTFGSADGLTDLMARAEIRLAPRLTAFAGMRWFEFDLTDGQGERTLQEEMFVGAGWRF